MRILVLNQYFHPDQASTGQLLTELCEDLAGYHDVTVVAGRPSYNPVEDTDISGLVSEDHHRGIRVLRTWSTGYARGGMAGRASNYATYLTSCLVGAMSAERPDVVLTMTDPPIVAAAALATSRIRRVPFVYVNQDVFPEVGVVLGRLRNRALVHGLSRLNRSLRRSAARVVAIGRDMEQQLLRLGVPPERLAVIPNWADGMLIRPSPSAKAFRERHGWADRFVVMHSGNVGLSQDLPTLLRAADRLRNHPDIVFAIVGDGASRPALERLARALGLPNLSFLPYQPKEELSASLGAADVHVIGLERGLAGYIVPSKVYGIMAAGRPFVAAVEEGSEPALLAEEHGCGIRVDPGHPAALVDAILAMRAMPREEMGQRGRQVFESLYDRPIATSKYRSLLEQVAAETPRGHRR